jgi:hypothetical protein
VKFKINTSLDSLGLALSQTNFGGDVQLSALQLRLRNRRQFLVFSSKRE